MDELQNTALTELSYLEREVRQVVMLVDAKGMSTAHKALAVYLQKVSARDNGKLPQHYAFLLTLLSVPKRWKLPHYFLANAHSVPCLRCTRTQRRELQAAIYPGMISEVVVANVARAGAARSVLSELGLSDSALLLDTAGATVTTRRQSR